MSSMLYEFLTLMLHVRSQSRTSSIIERPMRLEDELFRRIAELSSDRTSGAAVLTNCALDILEAAAGSGLTLQAAGALCRAHPTMASIWNVAIAAICEETEPGRLERFRQRHRRAATALTRFAVPAPSTMRRSFDTGS